jgi:dienelactone hydrolase
MAMKVVLAVVMLACSWGVAAQEVVKVDYVDLTGQPKIVEAVISLPTAPPNRKAVVLLHHAGGWSAGTTQQYAKLLTAAGYVTLDVRMFAKPGDRRGTFEHLAETFGALRFLASRPDVDKDQISMLGLSFGTFLATFAATEWGAATFAQGDLRFNRAALFYPVCWLLQAIATETLHPKYRARTPFPDGSMQRWLPLRTKLFAAGKDDYDSQDPEACRAYIDSIADPKQREATSLVVYSEATHGWDQMPNRWFEATACKGKGCYNSNVPNPAITERAKQDLLEFLAQP